MKPKGRLTWQQKRLIVAAHEFGAASVNELARWARRTEKVVYGIIRKWNWR